MPMLMLAVESMLREKYKIQPILKYDFALCCIIEQHFFDNFSSTQLIFLFDHRPCARRVWLAFCEVEVDRNGQSRYKSRRDTRAH